MRVFGLRSLRWAPLLAVCLIGRHAAAQAPITEEARQHFNAGVAYLQDPDGARYAEAYQEFLTAYAASPSWKILGNLGIAAMKLERDGEAIDAYTKYLQEGGNDIDPAEREQITRDMNTLKTSLVGLTLETTPAGAVIVDERVPTTGNAIVNRYGPITGPTKIGIKGGKHRLTAQLDGYDSVVWELDAQPGDQAHTFELKKTPPPPISSSGASFNAPPVDRPTSGLRIASYAAFGVGVIGLAGGSYFALTAKSKHDELNTLCGGSPSQCPLDSTSADGKKATELNNDSGTDKTLGIVGFAVGGVGIAAGVTLFILSATKSSHAETSGTSHVVAANPAPRIIPWVGYNSAGVVGQF